MTAGLTGRPIAGTKVSLAPVALGGLLGAALLAGSLFGAVIRTQADTVLARQTITSSAPGHVTWIEEKNR